MDFFNKVAAQLGEHVKSMAPGARFAAAASLVLIVASVGWLCAQRATGPDAYLMGGQSFSATQLRDMEGAFGKAGLVDYTIDGEQVCVPRGQQSKFMAALDDEGALPEDFGEHLRKAVNSSGSMLSGMLSGPRQEAQTKIALQSELQGVIQRMKGIENAFVHIAEETSQGFPKTKSVTASVGVQPRDDRAIDEATVAAIRSLVASAWGGLKPEAVTVVDLSGNRLFAGTTSGDAKPADKAVDLANQKRQIELDWQDKIARVLGIPGVQVTTNVELDLDGGKPRRVSVWIAIPQAYYEEIWRKRYPAPGSTSKQPDSATLAAIQQAETKKIEAAIAPLLGSGNPTGDRALRIAVGTIDSPATPALSEPQPADLARAWLGQHWQSLGMGGLIVAGLLILRSSVKSVPGPGDAPHVELPNELPNSLLLVAEDSAEEAPIDLPNSAQSPHVGPSDSLRHELIDRIREHPQAAASVLRTWIGNSN